MFVPPWLQTLQRSWFPRRSFKVRNASVRRSVRLSLESLEDRLAPSADAVVAVANSVSTPFSVSQQTLSLTANVSDTTNTGTKVNEGTVTFTVKDTGGNTIGNPVPGTVDSTGKATASFTLPAGEAAATYSIGVSYVDSASPANFTDGGNDQAGALTVTPATVKVVGGNTSASFSNANQSVTLTANVTDDSFPTDTVGEGKVTFTVKDSNGSVISSSTSGTVTSGKASAIFSLPANEPPGTYTVAVTYTDSASPANFKDDATDTAGKLFLSSAATTIQATSASADFNAGDQTVTLTATVNSIGGTVNKGNVLFTVVDSNGNTIGTATSGPVLGGSASVSYSVPGGTAAGSYTIEAAFSDSSNTFSSSTDNTQSLTINAANSTSLSLTSVSITPNLTSGKAQVTLTAQVSNPNGTVNEGVLSFSVGGVSAQANVSNGSASVQLSVPISTVVNGFTANLSFTDNASNFAGNNSSDAVDTSILNALLPANLTFDGSGNESMHFTLGSMSLFGTSYSSTTGLLSALSIGSLSVPVTYTTVGNAQVATVEGVSWGIIFHDDAGNFLGIADVQTVADGSLDYVVHDANNNVIGEIPYNA